MSATAITEGSLSSLLQRLVSPSWQNKSFLLSSPRRTLTRPPHTQERASVEAQGPSRGAAVHTETGCTKSAQLALPEGSSSVSRETEAARPPPWRGVVEAGGGAGGQGVPCFLGCAEQAPR